jgi:RimJ/RimL family protein N-acetyltransferase
MAVREAPTLLTERLRLRPFESSDEAPLLALFDTPEVRRYLWDDRPVSRQTVREQIAWSRSAFAARGLGHFTLRTAGEPDRVRGFAGLRPFGEPERIEVLYGLEPALWGRGLATEAARAVLRYGFDELGLAEIFAGADPPNAASFRVMERLGMRWAFDTELGGNPARYHRIAKADLGPGSPGPHHS